MYIFSSEISHCLNGRCGETIDSRDSVKCSPDGFSNEHFGWYICQHCHACCSNRVIQIRQENLIKNRRNYVCHTEGHKDIGVMFCNECGSKMNKSEGDPEKRKEVKQFLKRNSKNDQFIASYGQRPKDGGWWFRFVKGQLSDEQYEQKLRNLTMYGFNVPNIKDKSLKVQLVAEPFAKQKEEKIIFCSNSNCGKTIIFSDNFEQALAIYNYHIKFFLQMDI